MKKFQNENSLDRLIRAMLGEIALLTAYFWVGGLWQILFYILGAILLFTAISGFCALYPIFKINTASRYPSPINKKIFYSFVVTLVIILIAGSYYSNFFSRKIFLEDYNAMNAYYKQTLFNTGQSEREKSISNYEGLVAEYKKFQTKYSQYHPYVIKKDKQFNSDLNLVADKISKVKEKIYDGDLASLHQDLEEIRPIFQEMLKRNNFSMLAVSLVDFHDSMEKVIESADQKNAEGVKNTYIDANEKLKTVEGEANDEEIKTIRKNLDELLNLAENNKVDELSKKAAELKSSFVKVYLKRG